MKRCFSRLLCPAPPAQSQASTARTDDDLASKLPAGWLGARQAIYTTYDENALDAVQWLAQMWMDYDWVEPGITDVGVGLVEVLRRLRVHPIQYLLVGAALSVFFLLLVSSFSTVFPTAGLDHE